MKFCFRLLSITALALFLQGCCATVENPPSVMIDSFDATDGTMVVVHNSLEGKTIEHAEGKNWYAFIAQVPAAGRYRTIIRARAGADVKAWVEDYVDNPDNRTYNITGPMTLTTSKDGQFHEFSKVGSPLNSGEHPMRLHIEGGPVVIKSVRFELVRPHQASLKEIRQNTEGDEWVLKWSDEFNGAGLPNAEVWTHDLGNWGWGNNEPQFYTEGRTENARMRNGHLIIEARRDDMGHEWTSARLTTRGKVSFLYGKVEIRAKPPAGRGTWAAGWFLGNEYVDEKSWPYCGEIDILESVGREYDEDGINGVNHASCHTRAYYFKQGNHISSTIPVKNMASEFHTYAIEWAPDGIKAFLDGEHYYTYDKINGPLEWPFDQPQNLILNLAMGGGMGQAIDPDVERAQFIVDYVRVYEKR